MPTEATPAVTAPEKHHVVWTFKYHMPSAPEKDKGQYLVTNRDLQQAIVEFHAMMQLKSRFTRDEYKLDVIESNHITGKAATPQRYTADDLPPRNPDATKFELPDSLRYRIYPEQKPKRTLKSGLKEAKAE